MNPNHNFSIFIFQFSILLAGCGVYSFTGRGVAGIKTVAVESFDNRTAEFGIREALTDAVISRLLSDRTLSVVDPSSADAVLHGAVVSVGDQVLTFSESEAVSESQVTIAVEVALVKPGASQPIWQERLVGRGRYPWRTGSPEERAEGIEKAVDNIVQDLVNRLTSDW